MSRPFFLVLALGAHLAAPINVGAALQEEANGDPVSVMEMDEQEYLAWARQFLDALTPRTGEIRLESALATLNVPEGFYYLSKEDSARVLSEAWGNPPGQATLGMIFPGGLTPLDPGSWGVNILYEENGYVSDATINDLDFAKMLAVLKADTLEDSQVRVADGYEATALIGWAVAPRYDAETHKLYWAKELKFGENKVNILNYDIRILGRKGVLRLNFVADIDQLSDIEAAVPDILAMTNFDQGYRYTDFDPEIDQVADHDIGALVVGRVLADDGALAAAIDFLRKFGLAILAALAVLIFWLIRGKRRTIADPGID